MGEQDGDRSCGEEREGWVIIFIAGQTFSRQYCLIRIPLRSDVGYSGVRSPGSRKGKFQLLKTWSLAIAAFSELIENIKKKIYTLNVYKNCSNCENDSAPLLKSLFVSISPFNCSNKLYKTYLRDRMHYLNGKNIVLILKRKLIAIHQ